jgi:hypothetical protein
MVGFGVGGLGVKMNCRRGRSGDSLRWIDTGYLAIAGKLVTTP